MNTIDKTLNTIGQVDIKVPEGLSADTYKKMVAHKQSESSESTIAIVLGGVFMINFLITTLMAIMCVRLDIFTINISPLVWIGVAVLYGSVNVGLYGAVFIYKDKIIRLLKMT